MSLNAELNGLKIKDQGQDASVHDCIGIDTGGQRLAS